MKGLLTRQQFLDRVPELAGGQLVYWRGPDFFGGHIETAEVLPYPSGKVLKITTRWQAVQRKNGWHWREDKEVVFPIAEMFDGWIDDADHIMLNMLGRVLTKQVTFALPGGKQLINPKKVRYMKV